MADYDYEEGAFMALYFLLTFLVIILIPLTWSLIPTLRTEEIESCECSQCSDKHRRRAATRTVSLFRIGIRGIIASILWLIFIAIAYKLATTTTESKIYDPFAILGLAPTEDAKIIKKHYKRLSLKFHPDKVKLAINQTMEDVSARFVNITKAYKALTDETVRENLRLYGNPDGKQDFKVGIALPPWIIESSNNAYVLGVYGLLIGGLLPYFVGKWWFSSRQLTKDGVKGRTAEIFFKNIKEEDTVENLLHTLALGWEVERHKASSSPSEEKRLEEEILKILKDKRSAVIKATTGSTRTALVLLYAHLLRLHIRDKNLSKEQTALLLRLPQFLSSILAITLAHNWLATALHVMHLHAYLVQALLPPDDPRLQFPELQRADLLRHKALDAGSLFDALEAKGDKRITSIRRSAKALGVLNVLDAHFKVIGERIVTPGAIVQLTLRLQLTSPLINSAADGENFVPPDPVRRSGETDVDFSKRRAKAADERELTFLNTKAEAEDRNINKQLAHAPYWSEDRKPGWWVMIGDEKVNRIIVPPIRVTDVPYCDVETGSKPDRLYKLQFQAPPDVGSFGFQLHFVSDTFLWDDIRRPITLKVEDLSALAADEQGAEDEISDPDEDTLAGQMAALRGGPVKRPANYNSDDGDNDDDDESTTDGDQSSNSSDSDSASDSD
ncbi:Sec63 Brl domain-containing protein [Cantharellus anzutake]|uniref:Sec63 Brl domain-containing protein n=1 Tax=Cantharellus anzutake TaxID=1750568 RepID=UPI001904D8FD|nr:Sec63 Brl domain-containing protein [Cantharellus anzutake]KAF8334977.1 Sec63 Brl domain-containing protein [Cantharellus anzutake]